MITVQSGIAATLLAALAFPFHFLGTKGELQHMTKIQKKKKSESHKTPFYSLASLWRSSFAAKRYLGLALKSHTSAAARGPVCLGSGEHFCD